MRIQVATPISNLFDNIETARDLISLSDVLETRERSFTSSFANQKLFHLDFDISLPWSTCQKNYILNIFDKKTDLDLLSLQSTRCCEAEKLVDGQFQLVGQKLGIDELSNFANTNIEWLKKNAPKKLKFAIENNNYFNNPAYDVVTDGDFLSNLIDGHNIFFLFDIAHAIITAHNKGISYEEYCSSLPLNRTVQMHLCSPSIDSQNIARDTHNEPDDDIFCKMQSILKQTDTVRYITVEYYKEPHGLKNSLKRLKSLLD